jgi:hypothetical protein
MNNYEYTEINRLERPHKYIYTPYLGAKFVSAYFSDRLKHLKRYQYNNELLNDHGIDLYFYIEAKDILMNHLQQEGFEWNDDILKTTPLFNKNIEADDLRTFDINNNVDTELLLTSLVFAQINHKRNNLVKEWIDRLVQRFEVTKTLYIKYPAGFSKGEGDVDYVRLYWLFALSLSLYYAGTKSIKYLSTLLKVSDLLCSLDDVILAEQIPLPGLSLILQVEMFSVRSISDKIDGVDFAHN